MKRPLVLQAVVASFAIFAVVSTGALTQTTGKVSPGPAPTESSAQDTTPAGGCMPIGVTASGDVVFPLQCREFLERQKASNTKPAEEKKEKPTAMQSEAVAPEVVKPATQPAKPAPQPKVVDQEPSSRPQGTAACMSYRSYDRATSTFVNLEGQRRPCR